MSSTPLVARTLTLQLVTPTPIPTLTRSGVFVVYQIMMTDSVVSLVKLFWSDMTVVIGSSAVAVNATLACIGAMATAHRYC